MNTAWLTAAALAAGVTFCVHFFVGGRFVAAPLLADRGLPPASKWLNYYTWHITSLYLAGLTLALGWAASTGRGVEMVAAFTAMNASFSVLSTWVALKARIAPWRFPSTSLFAVTALFGALALI